MHASNLFACEVLHLSTEIKIPATPKLLTTYLVLAQLYAGLHETDIAVPIKKESSRIRKIKIQFKPFSA